MSVIKQIGSSFFFGKKGLQGFFSKLQLFALYGQFYGVGAMVSSSGEKNVLRVVNKTRSHGAVPITIIDCGANIGNYTQDADELITGNKRIYSLEPVLDTFSQLENRFKSNVNVVLCRFGLGRQTEKVNIFKSNADSKHASLYQRNMDHWDESYTLNLTEEISIKTLSDFVAENNIDKIDLLKMDAEGHEYSILQGAGDLLAQQKIDFIQFEFGVCNVDSKVFFKDFYMLLKGNYHILRILKNGFHEVDRYDERLEVFLTTNYLAVSDRVFQQYKNQII